MSLDLDDRQQAMLAEMGIRVWQPAREDELQAEASTQTVGQVLERVTQEMRRDMPRDMPSNVPQRPAPAIRPPATSQPATSQPAQTAPVAFSPRGERPSDVASLSWTALQQAVAGCQACKLCDTRRNTVFGVGQPPAVPEAAPQVDWMVIGEAPGENEDLQGEPFVGQAGKLLDNMLRSMGLGRHDNVFIANVLKCRPPGNRNPEPEEVAQCEPFLRRQVELLKPKIILAMGRFAVQSLLNTTEPIGKLRGRVHSYEGVPVVVTYHPAYLLRTLQDKSKSWADLCLAMETAEKADL